MSTDKKISFTGNVKLMKELQRTVAFKAYNTLLNLGDSKSVKTLMTDIHSLYFGKQDDPDSIGYAEQFLKGMGAFCSLFDEVAADVAKGTVSLKMKKEFHCLSEEIFVSTQPRDKGITMAVLSSKGISNMVQLNPRTIWESAKLVEKNGKKALALVLQSEYAEYAKTGLPPSGRTYDDYLLFIREAMFKELSNATIDIEDDEEEDISSTGGGDDGKVSTDENEKNVMKDSWMFPGYISFALWGPIIPNGMNVCHKAEAFLCSDDTKKDESSSGRKSIRRDQKKKEIDLSSGNNSTSHSVTMSDSQEVPSAHYLLAATIAQQSSNAKIFDINKNCDRMFLYLQNKVRRAEREVERWKSFLTPDIINDMTNQSYLNFQLANDKFRKAEDELDKFVYEMNSSTKVQNPYQDVIDDALYRFKRESGNELVTPQIHKKERSETPMSSIDILMEADDNVSFDN